MMKNILRYDTQHIVFCSKQNIIANIKKAQKAKQEAAQKAKQEAQKAKQEEEKSNDKNNICVIESINHVYYSKNFNY